MLALMIVGLICFLLQFILTYFQIKDFNKHYANLSKTGKVVIGKRKGKVSSGCIVMIQIDDDGIIKTIEYLQGITVFARCKTLNTLNNNSIYDLDEDDLKQYNLNNKIKKSILSAIEQLHEDAQVQVCM